MSNTHYDDVLLEKINNINTNLSKIEKHLEKMNGRIGKVEAAKQRQFIINGVIGAIGSAALGIVVGVIVYYFTTGAKI